MSKIHFAASKSYIGNKWSKSAFPVKMSCIIAIDGAIVTKMRELMQ